MNAKHIVSCCKKVSAQIIAPHDIAVDIILNNILVQRGLIDHEQKWEDRKTMKIARDEITIGTEHAKSEEWNDKGRIYGARLRPDLVGLRRYSGGN